MDLGRNSFYYLVVLSLLISCASLQKTERRKNGSILIRSALEEDICSLTINDSLYLFKQKINTDRSLGFDPKNWIELKSVKNPIRINVTFEGDIMYEDENLGPVIRKVKLDTVFDLRKGRYLIIEAGVKKVALGYSQRPINLD